MAIEAILLDLDELILRTADAKFESSRILLQHHYSFTLTWEDFLRHWMIERKGLEDFLLEKKLETEKGIMGALETLRKDRSRLYEENLHRIKPMNFAIPFLERINDYARKNHKRRFKLAVVSNNYRKEVEISLGRFNLNGLFATLVIREDVKEPKPSPQPYLEASRRFSLKPKNCLVLENSVSGVRSSVAAGMYVIAVPYIYAGCAEDFKNAGAHRVIGSLKEVTFSLIRRISEELDHR